MNRLRIYILFSVFAVIAALAQETNTPTTTSPTTNAASNGVTSNALPASIAIDGTTYENVRWGRVTPSAVTIFHKTGVATIPLEKLPPELRKQFGYDPQKAAAWQATEQKAAAARADAQRRQALLKKYASQYLYLEVGAIGKLDAGWVVFQVRNANSMLLHEAITPNPLRPTWVWSMPICLQGVPTSGYIDGQGLKPPCTGMVFKVTGTMQYEDVEGGQRTIFVVEPYDGK